MRDVRRAVVLALGLAAPVALADPSSHAGGPAGTPIPAKKIEKLKEGVLPLPFAGPVVYRCPMVNITFQAIPTGIDATGWSGHTETRSNVRSSVLWRTPNLGVEYDTIFCVYTFHTEKKVIQDHRVTVVERNAPQSQPICEPNPDLDHMGFKCRPLKPNENYH